MHSQRQASLRLSSEEYPFVFCLAGALVPPPLLLKDKSWFVFVAGFSAVKSLFCNLLQPRYVLRNLFVLHLVGAYLHDEPVELSAPRLTFDVTHASTCRSLRWTCYLPSVSKIGACVPFLLDSCNICRPGGSGRVRRLVLRMRAIPGQTCQNAERARVRLCKGNIWQRRVS